MKGSYNLSQDRLGRLGEIGFQWQVADFDEERCRELVVIKEEFGHCIVPVHTIVSKLE